MKINLAAKLFTPKKKPVWDTDQDRLLADLLALMRRVVEEKWTEDAALRFKQDFDAVMKDKHQAELRDILITALGVVPEDKKSLTGYEKRRRWRLQNRIAEEDTLDLPEEDVELLKSVVDQAYPYPGIVGQVWDLIDPKDEAKAKAQPKETIPGK